VLQSVAVYCSVYSSWLQCVAVADSDGRVVATFDILCCTVLQCVAVCCSLLQCVAIFCSVLQCVAVYC